MNATPAKGDIMVFSRAPVPGQTKTRLIPALGADGAARLHAWLIDRTLARAAALAEARVTLWCTPSDDDPVLRACAARYGARLAVQQGEDLGRRMQRAFDTALRSAPWAMVLGTDCPQLQTDDLRQAAAMLAHGADAVAGPAVDGGYYLLGLRRSCAALFSNMPWGTAEVWALTRERLETLGWSWSTLERYRDLDRPEDLDYFPDLRCHA